MLTMGHSLIHSFVRSHRSLVRSLAHSLAPELVAQWNIFIRFLKSPESLYLGPRMVAPQPLRSACHGACPISAVLPLTTRPLGGAPCGGTREVLKRPHWPGKGLGDEGRARAQSRAEGEGGRAENVDATLSKTTMTIKFDRILLAVYFLQF